MIRNAAQIARETGFGRGFIEAVKAPPDSPFSGRFSTVAKVEAWILSHPEFRSSHHWRARKLQRAQERSLAARASIGKIGQCSRNAADRDL